MALSDSRRLIESSCRDLGWFEMTFARVGGDDHDANGFLVEAFETTVALQIFEVAADGAFVHELIELFVADEPRRKEPLGSLAINLPTFAFGEGLAEKFEIGERHHGVDTAAFKLIAEEIEIEPGFEVVHAGLKKALAVETDPEADGAESGSGWKFVGGKINLSFFGHEIDVGEDDDANCRLFGNLRAPAGFSAGVIAFALLKTEFE